MHSLEAGWDAQERAVKLHASTSFSVKSISAGSRWVLRRIGVKVESDETIKGLLTDQFDKMAAAVDPPLSSTQRMNAKFELAKVRALLTPYKGL
jgi:hypothetical protein